MSKRDSGLFDNTGGSRESLIRRVREHGDKISPERVIDIWTAGEKIVWLEEGVSYRVNGNWFGSGFSHIRDAHQEELADNNIAISEIPTLLKGATTRGKIVGKRGTADVYEYTFKGKIQYIGIVISDNGYIVTAFPAHRWRRQKDEEN